MYHLRNQWVKNCFEQQVDNKEIHSQLKHQPFVHTAE